MLNMLPPLNLVKLNLNLVTKKEAFVSSKYYKCRYLLGVCLIKVLQVKPLKISLTSYDITIVT